MVWKMLIILQILHDHICSLYSRRVSLTITPSAVTLYWVPALHCWREWCVTEKCAHECVAFTEMHLGDMRESKRGQRCACDGVLRRWQSPGYSQRAKSLFHAAQTQTALQRGEHQSVPGLKREGFPSPITKTILTHGQHVHLKAYRRRLSHRHAQGRRISSSHTLLSSVPSLCLFMMTPALIPSHSLSITSANSLSSLAETVFLLSLCFSFSLSPSAGFKVPFLYKSLNK